MKQRKPDSIMLGVEPLLASCSLAPSFISGLSGVYEFKGFRSLSSFQRGNAHCAAGNIMQQLLRLAFRQHLPDKRALFCCCLLLIALPVWKHLSVSAKKTQTEISIVSSS